MTWRDRYRFSCMRKRKHEAYKQLVKESSRPGQTIDLRFFFQSLINIVGIKIEE
jgi:hypothetical protein